MHPDPDTQLPEPKPKRLSSQSLKSVSKGVKTPNYSREQCQPGLVHIGVGAFHRAHQAWFTEQAMNLSGGHWGIIGVSLKSPKAALQLNPQDGLYHLITQSSDSEQAQLVGAIQQVICAHEHPAAAIEWIANPQISIITLTITEKGYCYSTESSALDLDHPEIQHDFAHPNRPKTAIGLLVAGLAARQRSGGDPLALISCDNLSHNWVVLKQVVMAFARKISAQLANWIEQNVTFPSTMVDRIVPAPSQHQIAAFAHRDQLDDRAVVFTEPFHQWVIEDQFLAARPPWEKVGALLVDDVAPFEAAKLRLLNGSHSIIAYLGYVAGFDFVHQVVENEHFQRLLKAYMSEVEPGLQLPPSFDLFSYKQQLLERFANASLNHATYQIAQDGSQKIIQRWFHTLANPACAQAKSHALAVAGWLHFLAGQREQGEGFVICDPKVQLLSQNPLATEQELRQLLSEVGAEPYLTERPEFVPLVYGYLCQLREQGVLKTLHNFNLNGEQPC